MKLIHIINIIAAVLLSVHTGFAAPSEANFNKIKESWELCADGSQIYRYHKELTIFTHTAMNNTYGETFITYNPLFQELKINESYTVQKDGTIVKHPANAFVEVLPADAAKMPAYNHLKEMVIVHTGLELGATIVLDYSIVSKPGYLPEIDVCKTILETSPVTDYEMSFTYPAGKTPHYAMIADDAQPVKSAADGTETLTFQFKELPAMPRVPETSMQNGDIPGIAFTTYASNAEALKSVYEQFDSAENFTELTAEVIKDRKSAFDKFNAIYDYVMHGIASCPLSFEATGYRIRPAKDVIASAYATEMEKVNILYGMLKAAGMNAVPAVAYNLDLDQNVLALHGAGKWMVIVSFGKAHTFYLDAFSTTPAAQTAEFYVTLNNGMRTDFNDKTKMIIYSADIQFADGKPVAAISANFSNEFLPNYLIKSSDMLALDKETLSDHSCSLSRFNGTASVSTSQAGNLTIITLPETLVDVNNSHYARFNSERSTNLLLPYLFDESFEYTITLPEGMVYNTPDLSREVARNCGKINISICQKEGKIVVKRTLNINKRLITPEEYSDFRDLMIEWNDPHYRQVVVKNVK